MADFFKFFKKHKNVIFVFKSLLLYYLRFFITGSVIGLILLISWNLFLPKDTILEINKFIFEQFKLLSNLNTLISITILAVVTFYFLIQVHKGFQTFLRASLMLIGILSYLLLNGNNFFSNPFSWDLIISKNDILSSLFYISFYIILFDIVVTIFKPILRYIYYKNKSKLNTLGNFFNKDFVRTYFYKKFDISERTAIINDNPLKSLDEIYAIRKSVDGNNLFILFEESLNGLQNLITNNDVDKEYSKCICLDGPWGSGKTSLINIIHRNIKDDIKSNLLWIDFYPWNFTDATELIRDFFDTLNKEVIKKYKVDLQPNLEIYVDLVTPFIESNSFLNSIKNILFKIPFFASKNLNTVKHDLCKKLKNIPDKIVIVLDDLDRLGFSEIETVLKLVRQISSFPNILFILPFDYKRVSNLIAEERGLGYRDYLGKIVNNRIRLKQYTYNELESIFIYSVKPNPDQNEIDHLKDIFGVYVQAINKSRFEEVRYQESKIDTNIDITLTPNYNFVADLVKVFYSDLLTKDLYNKDNLDFVNKVKELLAFYQNKHSQKDNSLEYEIFETMSLKAKRDVKTNIENVKSEIEGFTSTLGLNSDELANIEAKWNALSETLNNGSKYESILNRIDDLKNINLSAPNNTLLYNLNGVNSCINSIIEKLNNYKATFEDNQNYHDEIRNWLVENLTARLVKELSIKIYDYRETLSDSRKQLVKMALEVAKIQLVFNK